MAPAPLEVTPTKPYLLACARRPVVTPHTSHLFHNEESTQPGGPVLAPTRMAQAPPSALHNAVVTTSSLLQIQTSVSQVCKQAEEVAGVAVVPYHEVEALRLA